MKYEDRIVCFIDILGFRNKVKNTIDKSGIEQEDQIKKINSVFMVARDILDMDSPSPKFLESKVITQFSDSIVISFKVDEKTAVISTLSEIQHLIANFISRGFLVRGGIALGKLIHSEKVVFGPALIKAYDTESKAAMYPRIILDETVLATGIVFGDNDTQYAEETIMSIVSKDSDGMYFVDFFSKIYHEMDDDDQWIQYLNYLQEIIRNNDTDIIPDIQVKIGWLKNKFNSLLDLLQEPSNLDRIEKEGLPEIVEEYRKLTKF